MAEIVNLRRRRKAQARAQAAAAANESRLLFGRPKAEAERADLERERDEKHLVGHERVSRRDRET